MATIEYSLTIEKPISEVFSYVSDFTKHPEWQPDITAVHQSEGKTRVGAMVSERRKLRVLIYHLDLNVDVIDYHLNKKIECKGTTGTFPVNIVYTFEPSGRTTRVTETLTIHLWGPHRLLGGFVVRAMRNRMQKTWNNLKQLMESRPAA